MQVLHGSRPLSRQRRDDLATFLDFQACTNRTWDRKPYCATECEELRRQLEKAGLGRWVTEYLRRLSDLEAQRPCAGGDLQGCDEVRSYREAVVRLSLAMVAAIASNSDGIEDGIQATYDASDVSILFRMAMQCQIMDDIIDYRSDRRAGLPSFLTASASIHDAVESTAEAARAYGARGRSGERSALPFETALMVLTAVTKVLVLARASRQPHACPAFGDSL
jgi:hypothetical protein